MAEHIPTTEEVRSWATHVPSTSVGMHVSEPDAAAFDRWLAQHDAEVRADERKKVVRALEAEEAAERARQRERPDRPWHSYYAEAFSDAARIVLIERGGEG